MSTSEIKGKDPVYVHCNKSNSMLPGIVQEVFEKQARVQVARQLGRRWLYEHREVRLSELSHRAGDKGAVDLRDFQVC